MTGGNFFSSYNQSIFMLTRLPTLHVSKRNKTNIATYNHTLFKISNMRAIPLASRLATQFDFIAISSSRKTQQHRKWRAFSLLPTLIYGNK
jgi:hypothetical protein